MRAVHPYVVLLVAVALSCKEKGDDGDSGTVIVDADADADADSDTDTDADTEPPPPECWVADPSGVGLCFDVTVAGCTFPTAPADSDGDGSPDSFTFLNQCPASGVQAVPFDNAARIPASTWVPGDPLPPVP